MRLSAITIRNWKLQSKPSPQLGSLLFRRLAVLLVMVVLQLRSGAATIYVDNQISIASTTTYDPATRSAGAGTQPAFRTIAGAATTANPGTTIIVRAGTYAEQLRPGQSGTASARIEYRAFEGETVYVRASPAINLSDRSYLVIQGLTVEDTTWLEARNSHHNTLQNCTFKRNPNGGTTGNVRFIQSHHNRILNNHIESGNDNLCIIDSDHNLIRGNTIIEGRHSVLSVRCGDYNVIRDNYFANSQQKIAEVFDCGEDTSAVPHSFNSTSHNVFENNTFAKTSRYYSTSGGNGIQYSGQRGIIRRNRFYDCNVGVAMQHYSDEALYSQNNRVYHNVFYDNAGAGIAVRANTLNNWFINNIVQSNKGCCDDCDDVSPGQIVYRTPVPQTLRFINNSVYYQQSGQPVIEPEFSTGFSVAQFSSSNPDVISGTLEADARFIDASGRDFRLAADSPMVDAGAFLTYTSGAGNGTSMVVDDPLVFFDGFGIAGEVGDLIQLQGQGTSVRIVSIDYSTRTITVDKPLSWTERQGIALAFSGSAPDIGAYERSTAPQPPKNLRVVK